MTEPARSRWISVLFGIVALVIGAVLMTRPFGSLAVLVLLVAIGAIATGVGELLHPEPASDRRLTRLLGLTWIALGVAVLLWPGLSLGVLALVVGVALIVSGVVRIAAAFRGDADQRWSTAILGVASVILGLVAIGWPDVTLLVVAVVFGLRLLLTGMGWLVAGVRGPAGPPHPRGRLGRWARTTGSVAALVVAVVLAVVSLRLNGGAPVIGAFYDPPATVPDEPGQLLRSEPFSTAGPDGAVVWRILYTTTRAEDEPAVASGLVAAPLDRPAGPRPVIAWAHGTTGVDRTCAPSLLPTGIESGSPNAIDRVIDEGWVMVSTDYIGLGTSGGHAYLVGEPAGRAVLDAVRAARQIPELDLADDQTVVWGHSQGGGAALWTGVLASTYAPDAGVIGVASLSPASDLTALVGSLDDIAGGAVFASFAIEGYVTAYPDVRFGDYVRPTAQLQVREIASRCLTSVALVSVIQTFLFDRSIFAVDPLTGPLGTHLAENVPLGPIEAPLLIAQGEADTLIPPGPQAAFVQARCDAGYPVDYRTYPGEDHIGVVESDSALIPELLAWTQDRLDGRPPTPTCRGS